MLGDLDLIHSAAARDRVEPLAAAPPATAEPSVGRPANRLSRFSMPDSSAGSAASGSLSSSLGGFATSPKGSFLMRQFSSGPATPSAFGSLAGTSAPAHMTAPISIPRRSGAAGGPVSPTGAGAAANDSGGSGTAAANFLRRHSMAATYSTAPSTSSGATGGSGIGGGFSGGAAAAPVAMPSPGAGGHQRMPALARSLSKGLSQSLDFR